MKKPLILLLAIIVSTPALATGKDSFNGKNMFCKLLGLSCTQKTHSESTPGNLRDHGNDQGIPPDGQIRSITSVGANAIRDHGDNDGIPPDGQLRD